MACAVGGCAGCAVPVVTDQGLAMKRVCVDGPVFDANAVFPPAAYTVSFSPRWTRWSERRSVPVAALLIREHRDEAVADHADAFDEAAASMPSAPIATEQTLSSTF